MNNKKNLKRESEGKKTRDSENVVLHVNIKKKFIKKKRNHLVCFNVRQILP